MRIAPGVPATLVHVLDPTTAPSRSADYPAWAHASRQAATAMLAAARSELAGLGEAVAVAVDSSVEEGDVADALRYVTSSGTSNALLTLGSGEEKELLEASPAPPPTRGRLTQRIVAAVTCSVLVARRANDPELFPSAITVGVDGSAPSVYAWRVAAAMAQDRGAELTVLVATGGKGPDLKALGDASPSIHIDLLEPDYPAAALVQAAVENGLVVVGSRGLHGLRALGSVSARVVALSPASVLVVRQP